MSMVAAVAFLWVCAMTLTGLATFNNQPPLGLLGFVAGLVVLVLLLARHRSLVRSLAVSCVTVVGLDFVALIVLFSMTSYY